ncbi:MAG TPA: dihydropteroate synthase [Gammaproteobacteria bacterium]|nr:dihydropteroate synthase [Gammaproteobacteria bacterium]
MKPLELGGRPLLMGVLNVTPDSFSDGGRFLRREVAVAHARQMVEDGAAIIDIGGESTRPGAVRVPAPEQLRRVLPVISELCSVLDGDVCLSIDTRDAEVADRAIAAGAAMINDISGAESPEMLAVAASRAVPIVLTHMQGTPESMQSAPTYVDVISEIGEFLRGRAEQAIASGVPPSAIVVDPGIGFGKTRLHNLEIMRGLQAIAAIGYPVMLGTSRKRFMGAICRETVFEQLVGATCATTVIGVQAGVKLFRVHDVRENRQAMEVALAVLEQASERAG